jgi:hypothetical protein
MNEEAFYRMCRRLVRSRGTLDKAASDILETLSEWGITHTPDGVRYTKTSIRAAISRDL